MHWIGRSRSSATLVSHASFSPEIAVFVTRGDQMFSRRLRAGRGHKTDRGCRQSVCTRIPPQPWKSRGLCEFLGDYRVIPELFRRINPRCSVISLTLADGVDHVRAGSGRFLAAEATGTMGEAVNLRLSDVRAVYRLIGECRELGDDPVAWRLWSPRESACAAN
jgi:hypothetical protein